MVTVTISKPIHQLNIKAYETIIIDYDEEELDLLFQDIEKEQLRVYTNDSVEIVNYKLEISDLLNDQETDFFEQLEEDKNENN